jgi:hypothetical protein
VEDHHVDRPGVEAQQCVKLTGTNSSIGLIVLINLCPHRKVNMFDRYTKYTRFNLLAWESVEPNNRQQNQNSHRMFFADLVVLARSPRPDPIPNSTVKFLRANGTKSQGLGE